MPFSATVRPGPLPPLLDCSRALLAGTVTDQGGEDLVGYPVHVWGPGVDTVVLSGSASAYGPSGWEVVGVAEEEQGIWYVQLHLYNLYRAHPPPLRNSVDRDDRGLPAGAGPLPGTTVNSERRLP